MRKFIIYGDELIMGVVEYHRDLLPKKYDKEKILGGGRWEWIPHNYPNKVFFFGNSMEYGKATKEQLLIAWENTLISPSIENCEIIFSELNSFGDVLEENNF